ncbi:MAG: LolA family protein [Limnochordia bacterium]|jgi:outer membrane lipoprotein-sorting protein
MVLCLNNVRTRFACSVFLLTCILIVGSGPSVHAATRAPAKSKTASPQDAPSIATVLHNVEARFADVKDIAGIVDLEQFGGDGSAVQAQTTVQATLPNLLRLSFVKPETFAGTLYVLDRKTNQVMQYSPITEQVIVSSIDQALSERFVPTTVEQLFSLPSPEDYDLTVFATETSGKQKLVGISAKAKRDPESPCFHFWIDQATWMVARMHVFDVQGQPLFTIVLRDIKVNQNLAEAQLKKMPFGAITVYR